MKTVGTYLIYIIQYLFFQDQGSHSMSDKTSQHSSQGDREMHRSQGYAGSDEVLNTQRSNDSSQGRRMKEKWEIYRESSNKMSPASKSQEDFERGSCYTATPKSRKSIRNAKIATTSPLKTQLCTPGRPQQSAGTPGTPESSWYPLSPYNYEGSPIIRSSLEKVNEVTDNDNGKRYSSRRPGVKKKVISVSN